MGADLYLNLIEKQREELEAFPIAYAFNDKQLDEALNKLGVNDISEVCTYMQMGDVVRKRDVPALRDMLKRHKEELYSLMKDKDIAYEAFLYEMNNHEYAINWEGDSDVLGCFCMNFDILDEMGLRSEYQRACREHMRIAHEEWDLI